MHVTKDTLTRCWRLEAATKTNGKYIAILIMSVVCLLWRSW